MQRQSHKTAVTKPQRGAVHAPRRAIKTAPVRRTARTSRRVAQPRQIATQKMSSAAATDEYDLVIIGGGPGGYTGGIKAGQLGLKVAVIESRGALGGTCLNVGCIPSKALLNASHHYYDAKNHFEQFGIRGGENLTMDHAALMQCKDQVVSGLTKGIEGLFKKNKVDYVKGFGKIVDSNTISVALTAGGEQTLKAKNIMIATGSEANVIPGVTVDEEYICTSTGALELKSLPSSLIVIGAGVIGLELGSVYARLGVDVTVIGNGNHIANGVDTEISKMFLKTLQKQGLKFSLGQRVQTVVRNGDKVDVTIKNKETGEEGLLTSQVVLLSTGRKPFTQGLGIDVLGIEMDRQQVKINDKYQTSIPNIYAIGDVVAGPMLAHKAEEEALFVVEQLAGKHGHIDYNCIPGVIYTHPEVATVGKSEDDLKAAGANYRVGKFPFLANSRARANLDSDGLVKIMVDADSNRVLGAHIMGPQAGELIQEIVLAMQYGGSAEDIMRTCHAHPCLNEAVKEAAIAATVGKPLNM